MTVWVMRNGRLVLKDDLRKVAQLCPSKRSDHPAPMVSRFEPMESPVTGKEISSWRERDRDMTAAGAVDPRDLPRKPFEKRKQDNERSRKSGTA